MLGKLLRDEDLQSLRFFRKDVLLEEDRAIVEYIIENKTFDIEKIYFGLSNKHASRVMELINSVDKVDIMEDIVTHVSTLENEAFESIPKMSFEEIAERFGHLPLHEAFEARKKLYLEEGI